MGSVRGGPRAGSGRCTVVASNRVGTSPIVTTIHAGGMMGAVGGRPSEVGVITAAQIEQSEA